MKKYEFKTEVGGDGECFCFFVDKETYISLVGKEQYEHELNFLKESHKQTQYHNTCEKFVEPVKWPIYPHLFFRSNNKLLKVKIEIEEIE